MPTTKAIVVTPAERSVSIEEVPVPEKVRDEYMLVKVRAIALNPTDWKHIDLVLADAGAKIGCDIAGVVEEVGSKVTKFKPGDRIAAFVHGGDNTNHANGGFGEIIEANECTAIKIPEHLDFPQAATLGVAMTTCGQGLYRALKLPLPTEPAKEPFPVLIHGGSTATGVIGIQLAKASGLEVIATSSPSNFDYLKSLGADHVFDYHSSTCAADIRALTKNKLKHAWDCAGGGEELCASALSDAEPSLYAVINKSEPSIVEKTNPLVSKPLHTLGYSAFGEYFEKNGSTFEASEENKDNSKFMDVMQGLLDQGTVVPVKIILNQPKEGLEGAIEGLDLLREKKVSGSKLVYTL